MTRPARFGVMSLLCAALLAACGGGGGARETIPVSGNSGDMAAALSRLQEAYAAGEISQTVYDQRRRAILTGAGG